MADPVTPQYRLLLIGRGLFLGVLGGVVCGVVAYVGLFVVAAFDTATRSPELGPLVALIAFSPIAGAVGGIVGGGIGLAAGLALAFSGSQEIRQLYRARLVTGSVAAAVPLAVVLQLHRPRPSVDYLVAAGIAAAAVLGAVLLTPRILNGQPPPRRAAPRTWWPVSR
ncbi:hypothetical protein [Jatrophihabitans sp.]|jgi:hypothetical protein|uniref:hypothetical protein n=1 Tax=Jatrophihabitans sp. TaxID=1932789 RepID=UPI002F12D511